MNTTLANHYRGVVLLLQQMVLARCDSPVPRGLKPEQIDAIAKMLAAAHTIHDQSKIRRP